MNREELLEVFRTQNTSPNAVGAIITAKKANRGDTSYSGGIFCQSHATGDVVILVVQILPEDHGGFTIPDDEPLVIHFDVEGVRVNGELVEDGLLGSNWGMLHDHYLLTNPDYVQK